MSGRRTHRGTPDAFSTARTRRGGTTRHWLIALTVRPSASASLVTPPAPSTAACIEKDLLTMKSSFSGDKP